MANLRAQMPLIFLAASPLARQAAWHLAGIRPMLHEWMDAWVGGWSYSD